MRDLAGAPAGIERGGLHRVEARRRRAVVQRELGGRPALALQPEPPADSATVSVPTSAPSAATPGSAQAAVPTELTASPSDASATVPFVTKARPPPAKRQRSAPARRRLPARTATVAGAEETSTASGATERTVGGRDASWQVNGVAEGADHRTPSVESDSSTSPSSADGGGVQRTSPSDAASDARDAPTKAAAELPSSPKPQRSEAVGATLRATTVSSALEAEHAPPAGEKETIVGGSPGA